MANIKPYTDQIASARFGEQVRSSIVNALLAMNSDINDDTQSAGAYAEDAEASAQSASNTATALTNTLAQIETDISAFETAENLRASAESNRVSAEQARVIAEQARENQETGYVAQARNYAEQAAAHATSDYAQLAKSWAVGNTGGTREDEATNNSKYWSEQSAATANERGQYWSSQLATSAGNYMASMQAEVAEAEMWATGETGGTPSATNNAEYYAGQAAATANERGAYWTEQLATEAAGHLAEMDDKIDTAEMWVNGGTDGTPSETNNAYYWSERARTNANERGQYWDEKLQTDAESWVHGGTATRTGEDTDNAQYWSEQAHYWYEQAGEVVTEGGVTHWNGRTGSVDPASGDYTADMIIRGTGTVDSSIGALEAVTATNSANIQTNTDAIAEKVDQTTPLIELDTTAAASTVDGQLTAALTALGWLNDVIVS